MAMNLASKYSTKVDERFKRKLLTQPAVNEEYDWAGVATIASTASTQSLWATTPVRVHPATAP